MLNPECWFSIFVLAVTPYGAATARYAPAGARDTAKTLRKFARPSIQLLLAPQLRYNGR
jgi:hypothetical protein